MGESFGTTTRAAYSMFDCTFTTGWRLYARRQMEEVNSALALFWLTYVVGVNFMVMKVVSALFVKQTFAVADADNEKMGMEKLKRKKEIASHLRHIFAKADTSGDGSISKMSFRTCL